MLEYYWMSLGLVPFFTSRTFVPLFAAAGLARFGGLGTNLFDAEALGLLSSISPWLYQGWALALLGLLALGEIILGKSPELRELALLFDAKLKATAAFLLCFFMVNGDPNEIFQRLQGSQDLLSISWGQPFAYTWAVLIGFATWMTAGLRNSIYGFLIEVDENDDLGLQGLLSWLEDGVGFTGVIFVVLVPMLSAVVMVLTVLCLWLTKKYLAYREERLRTACEGCAELCAPCGPRCPKCNHARSHIQAVGLMGTIKKTLAPELALHTHQLRTHKRCPSCAERLKERRLHQICSHCHSAPFADQHEVDAYLAMSQERLPQILLALLAMGLVPVLGLIVGIVYYRLSIIASLRCYVPRGTGIMARWTLRLFNIIVLCFQPVPILGMFTLPVMCLANFMVYKSLLKRQAARAFLSEVTLQHT